MKVLQEFELYTPVPGATYGNGSTKELTPQEIEDYSVVTGYFLRNEDGDWYVQARTLREENPGCVFLLIDTDGLLKTTSEEPDTLWPAPGLKVVIAKKEEIPENIMLHHDALRLVGGEFVSDNEFFVQQVEGVIETELAWATARIGAYQDMIDLDYTLSDDQKRHIKELKMYRVKLLEIDTSKAPDVFFPERPTL
ncbi:tail fiber assembly protein [Escherichia coli]|uniref:tail fiber assembly protein n=1 Tax=Escherichia coli TaxID=562 RepID=UPI000CFB73EA|nr:tail fiber assembly protein [Escherichia coli]